MPGAFTFFIWLAENTPGSVLGFLGFLLLGLLVSLFYPLAVLLAVEAPGSLVPARWRVWWRRGQAHRPAVRKSLRRVVYAADRQRCALPWCHSSASPQLDHVRPWSVGGRTSYWNFVTLCGYHNKVKSNYWEFREGRHMYHPFDGHADRNQAALILAFEKRYRRSPARFVRAALAL